MGGRLTRFLLALATLWLIVWGAASLAGPRLAAAVMERAIAKIEQTGLSVHELSYERVRLAPWLTRASLENLTIGFDLRPDDGISSRSTMAAGSVTIDLTRPLSLKGRLTIEELEVLFDAADRPRGIPFDRFTDGALSIDQISILEPRRALTEVVDGLEELFLENALVRGFEFTGEVIVRVRDISLPALLYTERQGDQFRLRFRRDDIRSLVEAAAVDLSPEQIEIVSVYPLRVPFIVDCTDRARALSYRHHPTDAWRRDALRHVCWSFLLTREFGSDFAKEVTDAQEAKAGNTRNERLMDFHNNAVGRLLANEDLPFEALPQRVELHPNVIHHPDEVDSRVELLR